MEQYFNIDSVAYIEVKDKKVAHRFTYSKAVPEKRNAFFKVQLQQDEGWYDDDGTFYNRQQLTDSFKGKFDIDNDGQTVIVKPRVEIELTNLRVIIKYFLDYEEARMYVVQLTQNYRNMIKFQ